jgi:voltage-gated potassium channel
MKNLKKRPRLRFSIEAWLEIPIILLGAVWLILLFIELVWGLSPFLEHLGILIWIIFIIDFAIRLILAPKKLAYLRSNWFTAVSLLVPALRVLSLFRLTQVIKLARLSGSIRLMKILGSVYRSMNALRRGFSRHGFGYIIILTIIVIVIGAAGMLQFEKNVPDPSGIHSYAEALWWTAMIMTTVGSAYWPTTTEGRILCFFLALYAFGIFGYITARFAAFIVGRDSASGGAAVANENSLNILRTDISAMDQKLNLLILEIKRKEDQRGNDKESRIPGN